MNCEKANEHLNEYLDGELSASIQSDLRLHLESCTNCRDRLAELQSIDEFLRGVSARDVGMPSGIRERVFAEIRLAATSPEVVPTSVLLPMYSGPADVPVPQTRSHTGTVKFVAATAIVTLFIMFGVVGRFSQGSDNRDAGRIEVASGHVMLGPADAGDWTLAVSHQQSLKTGVRLKTSDSGRCQIRMGNNTVVRVDANTDVILIDDDHLELLRGRVFCRANSEAIRISLPDPALLVRRATEVHCPEESELQCDAFPGVFACQLAGEFEPESLLWQLPLLGALPDEREEIRSLVESGLARLGQTKASYASEALIRSFGESGAIPLLAYVESTESREQPEIRRRAMRIAVDLVTVRQLTELRALAYDSDQEIAALAAQSVRQLQSATY